ncbi:MAG TPA: DMT family transporter [Burkholderiaceae bacterium]|nr:DMT family transporter [Burkholderiaceae bacterium]
MSPQARHRLAVALIFITPGFWSANYIVARSAIGVVEPHMLALMRWCLALMLMLPFAWPALRRGWPQWAHQWPHLLVLGALGMWICGAFVYIGAHTTVATNIGLLYASAPVMIALASALCFAEPLSRQQAAGAALALSGTVFVLAKGSLANLLAVRFTAGDAWVLAAVIAWTVYSLLLRHWQSPLDAFSRLTAIVAGGIVVLIPFTLAEGLTHGWPAFDGRTWLLAAVVAVLPGFGAYQAYSFMQQELGAARTGITLYLGPIWAALVAWALLGEQPQTFHLVGALMILPGVFLATRSAARRPSG